MILTQSDAQSACVYQWNVFSSPTSGEPFATAPSPPPTPTPRPSVSTEGMSGTRTEKRVRYVCLYLDMDCI